MAEAEDSQDYGQFDDGGAVGDDGDGGADPGFLGGDFRDEECDVDQKEEFEDDEHETVATEGADEDEIGGKGDEGGFVEIQREDENQEIGGGDADPGEGVGECDASGEHAAGADEIERVGIEE